jgi:bacillithiol system protein YtxJ
MNWIELTGLQQLDQIRQSSLERPQVIFKHSTRCSVSSMALHRLERSEAPAGADFYLLDLIRHREISNTIAESFSVYHESPQVLIIRNGECVYDESHSGINMEEIREMTV